MKKKLLLPILLLIFTLLLFLRSLIISGKLPIPADTIIGLYHPFRDLYAKEYPRGIPFKNFLITDPIRQQYPWRLLAIENWKHIQLPLWNPYSMAGTPLLANFQTAAFYPFNKIFFILPFQYAWSILIILQLVFASVFMYLYLRNLRVSSWGSTLAALAFSFSGFSIAWLEWGTILQTALWLPLILLSIDKLVFSIEYRVYSIKNKAVLLWSFIYLFSLVSSFFAGHLQTFFYVYLIQLSYFFIRWLQYGKKLKVFLTYFILNILFLILTFVQWIPTLQLISQSARDIDVNWKKEGWFIPWQHLAQFIAPDFFGNPTTLNYWGVWNYGEFIGYIGILPLVMAFYALFFRYDRKTLFFGSLFFLSLLFSFPTFLAKIPYWLHIPFLSTAQPTRLLFVTDFSLAVLAGLGFDYFQVYQKKILYLLGCFVILFGLLWIWIIWGGNHLFHISVDSILVAKRNVYLPTFLFAVISILLISQRFLPKRFLFVVYVLLLFISSFDLVRFADKFEPFTSQTYLYPETQVLSLLQHDRSYGRIMATDSRILPPNFSVVYHLQSIDGYDPLYLRRYGELIAASERRKPDISAPFGFNRIITPQNFESPIINLLGVKYVLSLSDINNPSLKKILQEGETRVYENMSALPRVFFVRKTVYANSKDKAIQTLFSSIFDAKKDAVIEYTKKPGQRELEKIWSNGTATIKEYTDNKVVVETNITGANDVEGFLVLTDTFYPTWNVRIINEDGSYAYETNIIRTDYNFRGVIVPSGKHRIEFYSTLF